MSASRTSLIITLLLTLGALFSASARADFGGYEGSYGGGGNYGGSYGGSYGGGYGGGYRAYGGGSAPIISLELNAQESLNSSLRVAAREGKLKDLQRMVLAGGDINSQSDAGVTALIYAARNCSTKVVAFLLSLRTQDSAHQRMVKVNLRDRKGRTALMVAAGASCPHVVRLLLDVPEIDVSVKDGNGLKLRDYALYAANLEVGGPSSETYSLILAAERRMRKQAAGRVASRRN
jgi:hypothetical protein